MNGADGLIGEAAGPSSEVTAPGFPTGAPGTLPASVFVAVGPLGANAGAAAGEKNIASAVTGEVAVEANGAEGLEGANGWEGDPTFSLLLVKSSWKISAPRRPPTMTTSPFLDIATERPT
mmetsp:Transcript_22163/g.40273  ORF Transcript_22163/g.40273 Transcript_22163/m.40273 type:complete len:120 (-) Transcript_22163:645-1004(-)